MAGPKVTFKVTTSDNMPDISNGQLIFVEDEKKIYLDFHGERKCYTPDVSNAMNYIGVFDTDSDFNPTKPETWIIGGETIGTPKEKDIAVFGTKEFMFRGGRWWEIGDEDAPTWN